MVDDVEMAVEDGVVQETWNDKDDTNSQSHTKADGVAVSDYLCRILAEVRALCNEEEDTTDHSATIHDTVMKDNDSDNDIATTPVTTTTTTIEHILTDIANGLLRAVYRNHNTATGGIVQGDDDPLTERTPRPRSQSDCLRLLLYTFAPVAMDVAARVASVTCRTSGGSGSSSSDDDDTAAAFVLFSIWLPVAPQLLSLVTEWCASLPTCPVPSSLTTRTDNHKNNNNSCTTVLLLVQAAHDLCRWYVLQREQPTLLTWWNWSPVFGLLHETSSSSVNHPSSTKTTHDARTDHDETTTTTTNRNDDDDTTYRIRWYAARIVAYTHNWSASTTATYLERHGVHNNDPVVPTWLPHPWDMQYEELDYEQLGWNGQTRFLFAGHQDKGDTDDTMDDQDDNDGTLYTRPSLLACRQAISLHPFLCHVGDGLVFYKHQAIRMAATTKTATSSSLHCLKEQPQLVRTHTTCHNLSLLGTAMCIQYPIPPAILVCADHGAGKSSLIRHLARQFQCDLLEIHVDEETDTKTLVGSYTVTDIPGEFEWRPGALTRAVRQGQWVLLEDMDRVPAEIQASLQPLFKERLLPTVDGQRERCHPNFRLFGTVNTTKQSSSGTDRVLHPTAWRRVQVESLPLSELREIALVQYPGIPHRVVDSILQCYDAVVQQPLSRSPSVRDLLKVLRRIAHGSSLIFEKDRHSNNFATERQRTLCLAEVVDVFLASTPDVLVRRQGIRTMAACLDLTAELGVAHAEARVPKILLHPDSTEVGRVHVLLTPSEAAARLGDDSATSTGHSFASTPHALRLLEQVGVCLVQNEPCLLVGETGTGKTTVLQHLARYAGRELVVQNLSLQTDSADLLGGYRPLEMQHVARRLYQDFVDIFTRTLSRKQNAKFLEFAAAALKKEQWKTLSQAFRQAATLGLAKMNKQDTVDADDEKMEAWTNFHQSAQRFEQQRIACNTGLAFSFSEGALVDAIRTGKWVLLDEINLASSETLQRLCGLLDDSGSSLTLTERGDAVPVKRHASFRLFAAMNPATDSGKKDLTASIRARFTELYVDELVDPIALRLVAARYIANVLPSTGRPPELTETVITIVDLYMHCRELADRVLADGSGQKPRYTLRTLSRALTAARSLVVSQKLSLLRALVEGFELSFQGPLDEKSLKTTSKTIQKTFAMTEDQRKHRDHPGKRPGGRNDAHGYTLIKPFWIRTGPLATSDWSEMNQETGRSRFILTHGTSMNLRRLARAIASGPWPVLLEGPTSAGKTTLVEYIAARCGHHVVRINNHEHTDVQEYTGGFTADSNGLLSFQDGILVQALRKGHWVILDELNLAPSEVLEALNRLLDDNRELYLPEINETITPHEDFRLFATQNPSGAYGGRKPLSRAFRNRFVEIQVNDIPSAEIITILEKRCGCPPSHSRILVQTMESLRQRRSKSGVFLGKDGYITPRDLLRWAGRGANSKVDLAHEGYMLLAERLRTQEEKDCVQEEIEKHLKVTIDLDSLYYGITSDAMTMLNSLQTDTSDNSEIGHFLQSIAPTKSLLRLSTIVLRCIQKQEPVLLVGDTGCGKTVAVQLLSHVMKTTLHIVNCHQTTETADLIGSLRPIRGRSSLINEMLDVMKELVKRLSNKDPFASISIPPFLQPLRNINIVGGAEIELPENSVSQMNAFVKTLSSDSSGTGRNSKRRKLNEELFRSQDSSTVDLVAELVNKFETLHKRFQSLFEWTDGPLVQAMKLGDNILLDEMSLADDAVLERLNSVLEPSRTIVLAEKGSTGGEQNPVVTGHEKFHIFATMNPGGDFGKRELSPALRSRFTEIWVPPVNDHEDICLVLGRALAACKLSPSCSDAKQAMVDYVEWFNNDICADPSSTHSELSLSLRDMLTWAQFMVEARRKNNTLCLWDAYFEGARLMHLDGLGLGTGLSLEDASSTKVSAHSFIHKQVSEASQSTNRKQSFNFFREGDKFGVDPYWIDTGTTNSNNGDFNFSAPTTALNVLRVLRAMQLTKPVLLEGSPGVGKTSLVAALAAASGHKLVRINLSEQTDIADLIGSDLPVPETDATGTTVTSFRWFDGVLLSAIKNGDWVLLDELNLASQSVLEGLNSCLDHRAAVYVPELGESFDCPTSFRVFAAQNPLAQGGGRKGLPKSFLNRFTKVYVDMLSDYDLGMIVKSQFPHQSDTEKLIHFNSLIHDAVVTSRSFGRLGTPWEFNLRDIFRLCQLFHSSEICEQSDDRERFTRDLYLQRFRTMEDRKQLQTIYKGSFVEDSGLVATSFIQVCKDTVQVGNVSLSRSRSNEIHTDISGAEKGLQIKLLAPLEAVARCIKMNWPCLIVGSSLSGKTSLIRTLAELCNSTVTEITLSSSSDVSELVGCFEQIDRADKFRELAQVLLKMADIYIFSSSTLCLDEKVSRLVFRLRTALHSTGSAFDEGLACALELALLFESSMTTQSSAKTESLSHLRKVSTDLKSLANAAPTENSHFTWKDGVLVKAMTEGCWLHLKNANLCPSSVLDRLNPVLEPGGSLLLAECATEDKQTNSVHREVKCHPNFRVFLSVDPGHGEVSRAMRNRCVEISVLESYCQDQPSFLDALESMTRAGLRSYHVASWLLMCHSMKGSRRTPYSITNIASAMACLLKRGLPGKDTKEMINALNANGEDIREHLEVSIIPDTAVGLVPCSPRIADGWALSPRASQEQWLSRILSTFYRKSKCISNSDTVLLADLLSFSDIETTHSEKSKYEIFHSVNSRTSITCSEVRNHIISLFLSRTQRESLLESSSWFGRLEGSLLESIRYLSKYILELPVSLQSLTGQSTEEVVFGNMADPHLDPLSAVLLRRLPQLLKEHVWQERIQRGKSSNLPRSVLNVSFYISDGRMDRNLVSCSLTPFLYPFFCALNEWMAAVVSECFRMDVKTKSDWAMWINSVYVCRDGLWNLLHDTLVESSFCGQFGFSEAEFTVYWLALQKKLKGVGSPDRMVNLTRYAGTLQTTISVVDSIEAIIFGNSITGKTYGSSVSKYAAKPVVPRTSEKWRALLDLGTIGDSFSFPRSSLSNNKSKAPLKLHDFIEKEHCLLFVSNAMKFEVLGAMCTVRLQSTDKYAGSASATKNIDTANILPKVLSLQMRDARRSFSNQLRSMRLDADHSADQGTLTVDELEDLLSQTVSIRETFNKLSETLLDRMAAFQIAAIAEYSCEMKEIAVLRELGRCLAADLNLEKLRKRVVALLPFVKDFIGEALSLTLWDVRDLVPFQSLVWFCEGCEGDIEQHIGSLFPAMFCNLSKRSWSTCADLLMSVSTELGVRLVPDDILCRTSSSDKIDLTLSRLCRQSVPSSLIFSLVGDIFKVASTSSHGTTYLTIENFRSRKKQCCSLLEIIGSLDKADHAEALPFEILLPLSDLLTALKSSFPLSQKQTISEYALHPLFLLALDEKHLLEFVGFSTNLVFREHAQSLFLPLVNCLKSIWNQRKNETVALDRVGCAKIYLGLLRYKLLLPENPLDPGRKPIAKLCKIDRRVEALRSEVVAIQLESGALTGDFYPSTKQALCALDEGIILKEKRVKQQNKVIERPEVSPPFRDLYRSVRDISETHLALAIVLPLAEMMQDRSQDLPSRILLADRVKHWKMTTESFSRRLLNHFEAYEDVVLPLVSAAGLIHDGVSLLLDAMSMSDGFHDKGSLASLADFPIPDLSTDFSNFGAAVGSPETQLPGTVEDYRVRALSYLSQNALRSKVQRGVDFDALSSWSKILANLVVNSNEPSELSAMNAEEMMERDFRTQFPDHSSEFYQLLRDPDTDTIDAKAEKEMVGTSHFLDRSSLSEEQCQILCRLHSELFATRLRTVDDECRIDVFRLRYEAAYGIHNLLKATSRPQAFSCGHIMAFAIASNPETTGSFSVDQAKMINFHHDPNPTEATKAAMPLDRLLARIAQLLTAFPDNAVLAALAKVSDRVRKLDLWHTSLGKIMTGLEIILKHAQDWEQHASSRVLLGAPLVEIGNVVSSWRKLELLSWPDLLVTREEKFAKSGQALWLRIHVILKHYFEVDSTKLESEKLTPSLSHSPKWVWKGLARQANKFAFHSQCAPSDLPEILKLLDTFCLTSPLGEFSTRLNVLKSFANQAKITQQLLGRNEGRLQLACSLQSLYLYYSHFENFLKTKALEMRRPLEHRLRQEVKLAKWDEQTYYASAESNERNHRKLMQILREYDEALKISVVGLLENELCQGIRSDPNAKGDVASCIPSKASLFKLPIENDESSFEETKTKSDSRIWTDPSPLGMTDDSYARKIPAYFKKMEFFQSQNSIGTSRRGFSVTNELCVTIIERIEALRGEKTTRPMKERALVDLFRELKRHGYSYMRWSIPEQCRRMEDLLQLPSLNTLGDVARPGLVSGVDTYYHRSLAEVYRMRAEIKLHSSEYMTARQQEIMLGFGEHGLLLLAQQRSMLSTLLDQRSRLLQAVQAAKSCGELPLEQPSRQAVVASVYKQYAYSMEHVRQLVLLLKTSKHLVSTLKKNEWFEAATVDIIAFLEKHPEFDIENTTYILISRDQVEGVEQLRDHLRSGILLLEECQQRNSVLKCLPSLSFTNCIQQLIKASESANLFIEARTAEDTATTGLSQRYNECASDAVKVALLGVQVDSIDRKTKSQVANSSELDSIWNLHKNTATVWAQFDLGRMILKLELFLSSLASSVCSANTTSTERAILTAFGCDVGALYDKVLQIVDKKLTEYLEFCRETAKLQYILLRTFRVLVAKGFCSNKATEDDADGGEGNVSNMTFEDEKDGTGMGEGDGNRDVTDEIENEEQILGLKSDQNDDVAAEEQNEPKKLDEEEAAKGMEMDEEFDGEMYDIPDEPKDNEENKEEDQEEIDREMGDEGDPNEEVVDEKLWEESDDEGGPEKGAEKLEQNSSVKGDGAAEEMITKEDGTENEDNKDGNDSTKPHNEDVDDGDSKGDDDKVNDDFENNYEENQGVSVRDENKNDEAVDVEGDTDIELDDAMSLDEADDASGGGESADETPPVDDEGNTDDTATLENLENEIPENDKDIEEEPAPDISVGLGDVEPPEEDKEDETTENPEKSHVDLPEDPNPQKGLGVMDRDGKDALDNQMENDDEGGDEGQGEAEADGDGTGMSNNDNSNGENNSGTNQGQSSSDTAETVKDRYDSEEVPNPLRNPGDASKFWHKKLNILEPQDDTGGDDNTADNTTKSEATNKGEFEFTKKNQESTTQALGAIDEEDAEPVDEKNTGKDMPEEDVQNHQSDNLIEQNSRDENSTQRKKYEQQDATKGDRVEHLADSLSDDDNNEDEVVDNNSTCEPNDYSDGSNDMDDDESEDENRVSSDLAQLHVKDVEDTKALKGIIVEDEQTAGISSAEASEARLRWSRIQSETHNLSRRLCEKLRLVMEPLVASKLRGDYRTGKRINMKRVIGYIASGYRKDKIWLRRTKPAKRNYRVLVAVDDSESMLLSGAGEMALKAMSTLAVGMSQLEVGEIGIASFGDHMNLIHPFHQPFTSESGLNVMHNFRFNQQRTCTALCIESALRVLEESTGGNSSCMQLVFMISDGRIERDSRSTIRRLVREMIEQNILLVLIIVEGSQNKRDSIINMKEVKFEKGKPHVKQFIEEYPFPYYIVLNDMQALPEVLGGALRQWFEMLARLQCNSAM